MLVVCTALLIWKNVKKLPRSAGLTFSNPGAQILTEMMEDSDEEGEEAAVLFQELLENISLEDSQSDDEDEAGALFQQMMSNIALEETECSLPEEDGDTISLPNQPLNIQLMGCRKMAAALGMVHKRRSLSLMKSFAEADRQALQKAVAHHNGTMLQTMLRQWRQTTSQRVHRRKSSLKSMESYRRQLLLRSAFASLVLHKDRYILIDSLRTMILRRKTKTAIQLWHHQAKLKSLCSLLEAKLVSQSLSAWRGAVVQAKVQSQFSTPPSIPALHLSEDEMPDSPPPPPPPSTAIPTDDDDEGSVSRLPASVSATPPVTSSNEEKENVPDPQRNIRKPKMIVTKKKPKLLIDMEQRQEARLKRRQEARERRERELIAKKEAEEKARADEEKRRQLLIEQGRLSTEMAKLYRTVSLMKRHFHHWKDASVVKNDWDTRKAYLLWSDTVLSRGFSGWRTVTAAAQKERDQSADIQYLKRPFAGWKDHTHYVKANLGERVVEISTHHRKRRALEQWLAQHYKVSKELSRLERIAMKRSRASAMRSALAGWRDASTLQRTEREIDERVQTQKREISKWLDGAS